jgi:maltose alpha-D-glucosyltransferase/alpha-amylase
MARRAEILAQFRMVAEQSFLAAYRDVLHAADYKWVTPTGEAAMLDLFLLEKAAYEIRYEAANRPSWLGIPLQGLHAIATRLLGLTEESPHA